MESTDHFIKEMNLHKRIIDSQDKQINNLEQIIIDKEKQIELYSKISEKYEQLIIVKDQSYIQLMDEFEKLNHYYSNKKD